MPQVTLKVAVDSLGWNALEVRGMSESDVMDEMEQSAYERLLELREEYGVEEEEEEDDD
jgi:hypothetical protein